MHDSKTEEKIAQDLASSVERLVMWLPSFGGKLKEPPQIITVFPKGTIVKYGGVPCELLQDTPYYSETIQPKEAT